MQTLILAIIIVIIIICLTSRRKERETKLESHVASQSESPSEPNSDPEVDILRSKINTILSACGYDIKYELYSHPNKTFTLNKQKMFVCTSCASDDRLLYMGLHEAAHILTTNRNEDEHGPDWEATFKTLLDAARRLNMMI